MLTKTKSLLKTIHFKCQGLTLDWPLLPQYLHEVGYTTRLLGDLKLHLHVYLHLYLHLHLQGSGTWDSATQPTCPQTGALTHTMDSGMLRRTIGGAMA